MAGQAPREPLTAIADDAVEVLIQHRQFWIRDSLVDLPPSVFPTLAEFITAQAGVVVVRSHADDHYARVSLRVADDDNPPPDVTVWDIERETIWEIIPPAVRLWTLFGGPVGPALPVSRSGPHRVQVFMAGVAEAEQLEPATFRHGVEQYWITISPII
jgi:hypothetical protein